MTMPVRRKRGRPRSPKWCCPLCYERTRRKVGLRYKCRNCETTVLPIIMTPDYLDRVDTVSQMLNSLPRSPLSEYIRRTWFLRERLGPINRYYRRRFRPAVR